MWLPALNLKEKEALLTWQKKERERTEMTVSKCQALESCSSQSIQLECFIQIRLDQGSSLWPSFPGELVIHTNPSEKNEFMNAKLKQLWIWSQLTVKPPARFWLKQLAPGLDMRRYEKPPYLTKHCSRSLSDFDAHHSDNAMWKKNNNICVLTKRRTI